MFDTQSLLKCSRDGLFRYTDPITKEVFVLEERFPSEEWDCPEAFKFAGIRGYEPMTAKELDTEELQDSKFNDSNYIVEEKFDGTRALVYFLTQKTVDSEGNDSGEVGYCRVFSRRISKKTGFYVENTDSLPHIREIDKPDLGGTIIDGEMFINGLPFKEVASTLNCLWDKAVERQIEKGFISFHAFDILFYRGIDLRKFPLERRKEFLRIVIEEAGNPYIEEVPYYNCGANCNLGLVYSEVSQLIGECEFDQYFDELEEQEQKYPNLLECVRNDLPLTPRAYYEMIVSLGGEGVMLKPKDGKYLHKRGWEYSKVKKFLTRELIVIGFDEPTKEYTGKEIKKWAYWEEIATGKKFIGSFYGDSRYEPITKFYYYNQVGNLLLGVLITEEEYENIPKNKQGEICGYYDDGLLLMQVCECAGFDDETREFFTKNRVDMEGTVVEVKANEIFKDSGKLRHPRYLRRRFDKSPEECTWNNHIM